MSDDNIQTIESFLTLLETQPGLFNDAQRQELANLWQQTSLNYDAIADNIAQWGDKNPAIEAELINLIAPEDQDKLPGDGKTPPPPSPEEYRDKLINFTRNSFPATTPPPSPPKG